MEKQQETAYRYNDVTERYKKMNTFMLIGVSILWTMFLVYLAFKLWSQSISVPLAICHLVIILAFLAINVIVFLRKKENTRMKLYIGIEMGAEVFILGLQTDAEFIFWGMAGTLVLMIPYYESKLLKRFAIVYVLEYVIVTIYRFSMGNVPMNVDAMCRMICVYLLIFVVYKVGGITKVFSDHALGAVEQQRKKQQTIMENVMNISYTVQDETEKSSSRVNELVRATESVAQSMREISDAANTIAGNIEEQNDMTQSIQGAIGETGDRSKKMVNIATDSNVSIQENMQVMEQLKMQSEEIASTNHQVTEAMGRLQNKTKEVEDIAGMILNISGQTNLLALNASIESARAGEAGRGFAVVADQIRQLAEQTKDSTEQITRIISELDENANEVVESVESSVDEAKSQNDKILFAAETFEKLNTNMTQLISDIQEIDSRIGALADSNNRIVENISHLSAATEEVTASADQVREMSEQNLEYAEEVKHAMGTIKGKTEEMKECV